MVGREIYARASIREIPRMLSLQDRNAFSPTYGCFKRTYWLDKVDDFCDALPQFGVLSLALAYSHDMPGNVYYQNEKILNWTLAGMRYWTTLQHRDGSFDEFYPNEHGWTGPTGFLLYAMAKSYLLLKEKGVFPAQFEDQFLLTCRKAADYIIAWDEHGVLANHHAMGVLPVCYAHHILQDQKLLEGYEKKLSEFLSFHTSEGWSLEYDGADIGYLSATVSFLGKAWKLNHDERLLKVMEESTEFLGQFVYPDGSFAGTLGSRNTLHFYSHGAELLAPHMPLAGQVADAMLTALGEEKLVPASIMADRYFVYRVPEHLESYIDFGTRVPAISESDRLPYERADFRRVWPIGKFFVEKKGNSYLVANASKGGVTRLYDIAQKKLLVSDCGVLGKTTEGKVLTSQWIDSKNQFEEIPNGFSVSGYLHTVPANKKFTPFTFILFRIFMLTFGWHTGMAYRIKGFIRRLLMLKSGNSGVAFKREVSLNANSLSVSDTLTISDATQFASLQIGDDFAVRYVPQSRYFQGYELHCAGRELSTEQLTKLNTEKCITVSCCTAL